MEAILYGYSVQEIFWTKNNDGYLVPASLSNKPQEWFGFDYKHNLFFVRNGLPEAFPKRKVLLAQYRPTDTNPYGKPSVGTIYDLILNKRKIQDFLLRYLERYGTPYTIVKTQMGVELDTTQQQALTSAIQNAGSDAGAILPFGVEMELLEANRKESVDVYLQAMQYIDKQVSKAVLGHADAADSTAGQLGNQVGAIESVKRTMMQDKTFVEGIFQKFLANVVYLNFGDSEAVPQFHLHEEEVANKERAERDSIMTAMGVTFNSEYFQRYYGVQADEFTITSPEQAPLAEFSGAAAQATIDKVVEEAEPIQERINDVLNPIVKALELTPEEALLELGNLFEKQKRERITADVERLIASGIIAGMASQIVDDNTTNSGGGND
jgi:phage gp29-like protein